MAPARLVDRNVRPLRSNQDRVRDTSSDNDETDSLESADAQRDADVDDGLRTSCDDDEQASIDDADAAQQYSNVSFGTLKQAHESLSRKRKRGSDETPEQDDKLAALRARLRQIKEEKAVGGKPSEFQTTHQGLPIVAPVPIRNKDGDEIDSDSDGTATSDNGGPASSARTSKHAPAALSSRHQVTRKRTVIDVARCTSRDPRFDAFHQPQQGTAGGAHAEAAYAFLRDYQRSEIDELKSALNSSANNEEDQTTLRRKIVSMENRLKTKEAKERQQDVLRRHRKEEREKVQAGKQPYYLKTKELKERALVEKFKGMKGKERDKLVEKRRLKENQREKKLTPRDRRAAAE